MNIQDVRELTDAELQRNLGEAKHELLNLRIQQKTGQIENTALIGQTRRTIARYHMETHQRARQQAAAPADATET